MAEEWTKTPTIGKVQLPNGNSYWIKDVEAREKIEALGAPTHFLGKTSSALTDGSTTNPIIIDEESVQAHSGDIVVTAAEQKEFIWDGGKWLELGDLSTLGDLAYEDSVTLNKGNGDLVLGKDTTFTAADSAVTFTGNTSDSVIGADATLRATAPTITVTLTKTTIGATSSAITANPATQAEAITGFGAHTKDTFVKSVSAETGKNLVTTSITSAGAAKTVLQGVTPTTQKLAITQVAPAVAADNRAIQNVTATKSHLATTTIPNVTGNTTVDIPNVTANTPVSIQSVTSLGTADTWSFGVGENDTLIISGANGTTPTVETKTATNVTLGNTLQATKVTLGTAITAATGYLADSGGAEIVSSLNTPIWMDVAQVGTSVPVASGALTTTGSGADIMTGVETSTESVASVGSAVTVATGATSTTGTGDAVVTGVTIGDSAEAITALGTATTATVLQSVTVTQPTITLAPKQSTGVEVATGIASSTATAPEVTFDSKDATTVVTGLGTATAAGQNITVGTNDNVKVAVYDDLNVTVS